MGAQLQAGELVHEAVQGLAHLGQPDELAQLLRAEVVVALPGQLLLLDALQHLLRDPLELPQRRLRRQRTQAERHAARLLGFTSLDTEVGETSHAAAQSRGHSRAPKHSHHITSWLFTCRQPTFQAAPVGLLIPLMQGVDRALCKAQEQG